MYKLLIKEKELMKWRLKNIIIFNYSNNKKFSILTTILYMYIEIQRFVQEEFEKRTIPVSSNFQYRKIRENLIPPSLCLPRAEEDSRLFERGTECTLVYSNRRTRNTYNFPREHKRRGGRRWAFKKEFERVSSVFLVRQATSCITILLQFPEQKLQDTFHHDVTGTKLSPVLFTFRPATSL